MQKILLFVTCFCILSIAQGQQAKGLTLSGKVTDAETSQPLAGANVFIADARIGAVTNSEGVYNFENIPSGHHILEVSFSGFNTTVKHIDVNTNSSFDFSLTTAVREQQGIIVTGVAQATNVPHPTVALPASHHRLLQQRG